MKEIGSRKGHLARFARIRKAFSILTGKPEEMKLQYLVRRGVRCMWDDNDKMRRKERGYVGMNWIHMAGTRDR
jgi:hypothetical protein